MLRAWGFGCAARQTEKKNESAGFSAARRPVLKLGIVAEVTERCYIRCASYVHLKKELPVLIPLPIAFLSH